MQKRLRSSAAAFLLLLAQPSPFLYAAHDVGPFVATVNGVGIPLARYRKEFEQAVATWNRTHPGATKDPKWVKALKRMLLDQMVDNSLLSQQAKKIGLKVSSDDIDRGIAEAKRSFRYDPYGNEIPEKEAEAAFNSQLKLLNLTQEQYRERIKKQLMIKKLLQMQVLNDATPPDDKEVAAYFERVKKYIQSGSTAPPAAMPVEDAQALMQIAQGIKDMSAERVRLSVILIRLGPDADSAEKARALKAADDIRAQLESGDMSFAEVARAKSEDPLSAPRGGDIGFVYRESPLPANLIKAAFSLRTGDISKPILTEIGYNIIRVEEKRASSIPTLDKFKDRIAEAMMQIRIQKATESYVEKLKSSAKISKNPALLATVE